MSLKLALSLAAALALSAASGVARADPGAPRSVKASKAPHSPSNDEIDAAETGVPASVDYPNRATPTNEQISAAEAGSPDSPDNKDQPRLSTDGKSKKAWQKLEKDNPHSTDHQ